MTTINTLNFLEKHHAGTGSSRALRRQGRIPAVLYGKNFPSVMFSVEARPLAKELKKGGFFSRLHTLSFQGQDHRAVVRDIQWHPVTDEPLHLDFVRVEPGSRVTVSVPITFTHDDKSPGLKRGGILNVVTHTVELSCLLDVIPDHVVISLEGLDIHSSIHVKDLTLPEGVQAISQTDYTIATIVAPTLREEGTGQAEGASAS